MIRATAILLLAAAAGCFGTPRTTWPDADVSTGGSSGGGGQAGVGGASGTGVAGSGAAGTGGPSGPVFVGGPCVVATDLVSSVDVFARASDGQIHRRAYDGRNWGAWSSVLDGQMIDPRSDIDCGGDGDAVHIVAAGASGAFLHASGSGTVYEPLQRQFSPLTVALSPSIAPYGSSDYNLAWSGLGEGPAVLRFTAAMGSHLLTPITTLTDNLVSAPDLANQGNSMFFVAFDSTGALALYPNNTSSGGEVWTDAAVKLRPPSATYAFSPTVCAEHLGHSFSVNVAAVTGAQLWFAATPRLGMLSEFSAWQMIGDGVASSPDCVVLRENPNIDATIHVVALSSRGTVLAVHGSGQSWVTTDLGPPP